MDDIGNNSSGGSVLCVLESVDGDMNRNLDGVYFRIMRDDKWQNICFSDLTKEEREEVGKDRTLEWWKSMAFIMADCLKDIGDQFDIVAD